MLKDKEGLIRIGDEVEDGRRLIQKVGTACAKTVTLQHGESVLGLCVWSDVPWEELLDMRLERWAGQVWTLP